MNSIKAFFLIILVVYSDQVQLPSSFKTCKKRDPNFKNCVREAAEYNIHQLNHPYKGLKLPNLNPLLVPSLTVGSGKSAVAVEQHFKNCEVYGLDHLIMEQFEFVFEKKRLLINALCMDFTKKCNYELNGRVLLLPVKGEGMSTMMLKNLTFTGYLEYEEVRRHNKNYIHFMSSDVTIDITHAYFNFDNLFNGDKALGDGLNKVLNENWKEVFDDVKDNYRKVITQLLMTLANDFFRQFPMEQIFEGF